jgi:hypothetical protein
MGEIFSRAWEVLVWLGPAADHSDYIMGKIRDINLEPLYLPWRCCPKNDLHPSVSSMPTMKQKKYSKFVALTKALFSRSY